MKRTRVDVALDIVIYLALTIFLVVAAYPILLVVARSLSEEGAILSGQVIIFPVDFTLNAYRYSVQSTAFWRAFAMQAIVTVGGTAWGMVLTVLMAYPLSRKRFVGRTFWTVVVVVPLYFYPGIIPNYLVIRSVGMVNTLWALIVPVLASIYVLMLKSYLENIDDSMEESARIDGASNVRVLVSVMLPVCTPVLASLTLFYAVGQWTNYLGAAIYLSSRDLQTLQLYLFNLLREIDSNTKIIGGVTEAELVLARSPQATRAAATVLVALPIVLVYPFIQRYFIHGLTIGSVKG